MVSRILKRGGSSITSGGSMKKVGGLKKLGCKAASPPARSAENFFLSVLSGPEITLMGSLQISTGSALGKVVHAVGLWA